MIGSISKALDQWPQASVMTFAPPPLLVSNPFSCLGGISLKEVSTPKITLALISLMRHRSQLDFIVLIQQVRQCHRLSIFCFTHLTWQMENQTNPKNQSDYETNRLIYNTYPVPILAPSIHFCHLFMPPPQVRFNGAQGPSEPNDLSYPTSLLYLQYEIWIPLSYIASHANNVNVEMLTWY